MTVDRTRIDLSGVVWRKSARSNGQANCVEVAVTAGSTESSDRVIAVRDSKNTVGPKLIFTSAEWEAFTVGVKDGEFDVR
jgi:hypothetical protein